MATRRNKGKLAAISRDNHEEHPRNNQARDTNFPRNHWDYITQVSEEIEGRVTKKLSQEFSRTKSRILGALSKLDEFFLNSLARVRSSLIPATSQNSNGENKETNEDRSQNDPHPEVGVSLNQSLQKFGPDKTCYKTLRGIFEVRRLPFDLTNSAAARICSWKEKTRNLTKAVPRMILGLKWMIRKI